MAFSDELKKDVEIDVESYNQKVENRIDELLNKYIKGNNTFIDDYYKSTGVKGEDITKFSFEEKKAVAEEAFKISDHDNGTNFSTEFKKKYENYIKNQESSKKEIIEILYSIQARFAERIKAVEKNLNSAIENLSEQENQIKETEDNIRDEKVAVIALEREIEHLKDIVQEIEKKINDLSEKKQKLEEKENRTPEEQKELENIKNQIDENIQERNLKNNDITDKGKEISEKNKHIGELEQKKSDLKIKYDESKKVYDKANEDVKEAREAYLKNGEEILKIAKENNINININESLDKEKNDKEEKNNEKVSKDTKAVSGGANGMESVTNPEQQVETKLPTNYSPDVMNDFANCSNSSDRKATFIDNPAGYAALCDSLKNRSVLNFWKNHRVKRALADNNKELLKNMKDSAEYFNLLNDALGSEFGDNEKELVEKLFDKKSSDNILNGFSKYSEQDMKSLYNIVNKLNSTDFSNSPEIARKINSEIMPYIKSGVLNDLANRKVIGRFNSKHDMTAKNQCLNYISNELAVYSGKHIPNVNAKTNNNPFTSSLYSNVNNEFPVNKVPVNNQPTKAPTQSTPEIEQR